MENRLYEIRSKLLKEKTVTNIQDLRFFSQTQMARVRAGFIGLKGIVTRSQCNRPLLIGNNVEILALEKSCLSLFGPNEIPSNEYARNKYFPTASSVGFIPYWTHLNPPTFSTTKLRLQANSKLSMGPNSLICRGTYISVWPNQELRMEANTYVGHNSYINTRMGLRIGRNTAIGHSVTIMDYDGHPIFFEGQTGNAESYGGKSDPIKIEDNVWIGFGSTIMKGITIHNGAIVGSKSVVTRDVPPNTIVAGNPAKVIRENVTWRAF